MAHRDDRSGSPSQPHAWLLTTAATMLGLVLLALAAAPLSAPAAPPASVRAEAELTDVEFELDEEGDRELEEDEDWEFEEGEEAESSADRCPLHSATAHATAKRNKLKLTVGYTTDEPASARIKVRSGQVSLGTYNRHLGRSGVLRFTRSLGRKHGDRVVVDIRIPSAGRYCAEEAAVLFK